MFPNRFGSCKTIDYLKNTVCHRVLLLEYAQVDSEHAHYWSAHFLFQTTKKVGQLEVPAVGCTFEHFSVGQLLSREGINDNVFFVVFIFYGEIIEIVFR